VAIHHLSHQDVAQWIEKTNRYTSRADRERVADYGKSVARFAHDRIDHWLSRTRNDSPGGYPEAVAVLRATYDLVDRLKTWEEERGLDSAAEFQRVCALLDADYAALGVVRDRGGETVSATPTLPAALDEHDVLQKRLAEFRARHDVLTVERDARAAEAMRLAAVLASLRLRQEKTQRVLDAERQRAEQATAHLNTLRSEYSLLQREHDLLQGSLRTFMRFYLPRLRRHLFGQRP
jgi:hypothetical protein